MTERMCRSCGETFKADKAGNLRCNRCRYKQTPKSMCQICGGSCSWNVTRCRSCANREVVENGSRRAENSVSWGGGRTVSSKGYIMVRVDDTTARGWHYEPEHRVVMAAILGRQLHQDENVHHINGIRDDNRPENLELWTTSQPSGQRVADKIRYALEIIERYGSDPASVR